MSDEPTPENNLMLRQMAGMRRDKAEIMEGEARVIELRGDLVVMENRIPTAITEVRPIAARLDEAADQAEA